MTEPIRTDTGGFAALGLDARLLETIAALGYEEPTPIQREAIGPLLQGRDLLGQAATGTGKTAAFALPLLQRLDALGGGRARPSALVLVPTRELAMQVGEAIHRYGRALGISVLPIYGGQGFDRQLNGLKRGVDVVVATPGRAHDHIRRGTLKLGAVAVVVLDEADEMFDLGFAEDLEAILAQAPPGRQTMLFSATLPGHIAAIARRHLSSPVEVRLSEGHVKPGEGPRIRQIAHIVPRAHKLAALGRVLDVEVPASALVFCRTRIEVDQLTEALGGRGYRPEALHGGMSQEQRDRVMRSFRAGTVDLLIATDVAARGLDVEHLSHVVNYDVPCAPEPYVHRIGRVGRAGRQGVAVTLAEPRERRLLRNIERATGQKIEIVALPSVADVRARQMEQIQTALREAIQEGGLESYRGVIDSLAGEFDLLEVALAALKLAHRTAGTAEQAEAIPTPGPEEPQVLDREGRLQGRRPAPGMARLFVGVGRDAGITPRDLVGAIANEAGLRGRDIGAIEVSDRFSLVEVPGYAADHVIESLRGARVKGVKVTVRPDRRPGGR